MFTHPEARFRNSLKMPEGRKHTRAQEHTCFVLHDLHKQLKCVTYERTSINN